ncbi:phosphoribosyl-AMP cyclohydrolase [Devriesea agamarum]|uniref:phosphoribosyl-AMP cyclohydrolase n=1 Tax=Devriesea agamarum TaxID=472569 RepID=UPI00071D5842|nr:phosphoribosyl-AMP cyclohydrolase [Devriesea agamarum]
MTTLDQDPIRKRQESTLDPEIAERLKRDQHGLICAVVQDYDSREVLMVAWMDDEALARTLAEGRITFWSRSRQEYWRKGDSSGHRQYLRRLRLDCDGDALLIEVDQVGSACHTGTQSCFDDRLLAQCDRNEDVTRAARTDNAQ